MIEKKRLGDYLILMTECLGVREVILMAIQEGIKWIIIQSDSILIVNSVNGTVGVPKDIVNLVEDVKC